MSFSRRNENIENKNIIDLEFVFLYFLVKSFFIDNAGISIKEEFANIMGKDSFERVALISLSHFFNCISNL